MVLTADMLARSSNLMRVAATTAMLVTSGLINNARALLINDDAPNP